MMEQRLAGIGDQVGINFKFGGKTGNTVSLICLCMTEVTVH